MNNYWYIASYPKSGNTWCRIFISELKRLKKLKENSKNKNLVTNSGIDKFETLNDISKGVILSSRELIENHLGIDVSDFNNIELEFLRSKIKKLDSLYLGNYPYVKVHDSFFIKNQRSSVIPTKNCGGVVYLLRHPADVAFSWSKFKNISIDESIKFLLSKNGSLCGSNSKLLSQSYQFLGSWSNHVDNWHKQVEIPVLTIKYEDMIENPFKEFLKISSFLSISSDVGLIKKAIELTNFSRLKTKEKKYGFREAYSNEIPFFRKGIKGEGLSKLNYQQLNLLESNFKNVLGDYGYKLKTL